MESTSTDPECASFQDDLAVLAVGALTGHERARLVAHLEECPQCSTKLEELSAAADALTSLIPDAIPSEGFSERTVARFRAEQQVSRRPLTRRLAAVAAVVVALALGAGAGELAASQGGSPAPAFLTAPLHSTVGTEGSVVLMSSGEQGWLVMNVHDAPSTGTVTCSIVLHDGTRRECRAVLARRRVRFVGRVAFRARHLGPDGEHGRRPRSPGGGGAGGLTDLQPAREF